MNGLFTILEGVGQGARTPISSNLMIIGRSKKAEFQIDDPLVSRRHLEVRVEGDSVFVENQSTHGSSLNGKPLVGVVSLNPGDILEIGTTKLRFDEGAMPAPTEASVFAAKAEIDGTRIADPELVSPRRKEEAAPDATRVMADDGTRMLNASELPNWAAQENKEQPASSNSFRFGFMLVVLFFLLGSGYWYFFIRGVNQTSGRMMDYKDSLYSFNLQYPLDWTKTADETGLISFGFGSESGKEWGRLNVYTDKDAQHEITGLSDGFLNYVATLKKRYQGFELIGNKTMNIHNATVVFYGFTTPALQGKGIYTLNADARIVVECVSLQICYKQNASTYSSLLQSFSFGEYESQQFIEFPQPDTGMQQLALANPSTLNRQVEEHAQRAGMLLDSKDVKPDNLFEAVQEYRKALQLAIAGPQRLPVYSSAAKGLAQATRLFNQALQRQRFEIKSALKQGDNGQAYWEANKMMQMVPDKTDSAYQEAYGIFRSLPAPKD